MPYLEIPGASLWYEDTGGEGAAVVFLHAFTGNTEAWEYQTPAFADAGYRCVRYDRRGWGRSRDFSTPEQTTYASDDLHALVEHLGLLRFHLIGTGGGGYVALDYAVSHPERLASLVVACSGGPIQRDPEYTAIGDRYGRFPGFQSLPPWFLEIGPTYRVAHPEGVDRWLRIEQASRQEGAQRERMRNDFTLALLETVRMPTLMLAAGADLYAAPPRMQATADRIPDCEFALMPDAGHSAYWEQPETWNRLVLEFIGAH
ncbi:MAG: alpha/beta hydrolase [Chloroflexota bacterium]|nr:alpha/beta hydrolase [Chloroflexota bacterium]MDE2884603.1 alpha/beta hydrolase [Chloroflexota bacterium]